MRRLIIALVSFAIGWAIGEVFGGEYRVHAVDVRRGDLITVQGHRAVRVHTDWTSAYLEHQRAWIRGLDGTDWIATAARVEPYGCLPRIELNIRPRSAYLP